MILIISKLGALCQYPDREMMKRTLRAHLRSLDRQTDKNFRLFMACHDIPEGFDYPWLEWCSVQVDPLCENTNYWKHFPSTLDDPGEREIVPYGTKTNDSGRKTAHGAIMAGQWAYKNNLTEFMMLRMDSDDMLARDTVEVLHRLGKKGFEAVYNRRCHIFDAKTGEVGEYNYIYSTTCNALKMRVNKNTLPRWLYLCRNHTRFMFDVKRDGIGFKEVDWTYCIVTNSGNSISGRPALTEEKWAKRIGMTSELENRYGLREF